MTSEIYLGTVAIEPNRWGLIDADRRPTIDLAEHLDRVADAGFDGVEVWEGHVRDAVDGDAVLDHRLGLTVFNTYTSFDTPDPADRAEVADWVRHCGSSAVKYNVGNDADLVDTYADRVAQWVETLPGVRLLDECHEGISVTEDPEVAARLFDRAGPPDRVQAIVHLGEDAELTRRRFAAYGERIGHVHVNLLGQGAPPLAQVRDQVAARIELLRELGFDGTWTVEFVHGVLTDSGDHPEALVGAAIEDLAVLRTLLA